MNLLSIQTGHNATVALMENGEITAALSQEKIDNVKNSAAFPADAIGALLKERSLSANDIDEVIIAGLMIFPQHCSIAPKIENPTDHMNAPALVRAGKWLEASSFSRPFRFVLDNGRKRRHRALRGEAVGLLKARLNELGLSAKPLHFIDHHTCHGRSAFHSLDDGSSQPALVFTLDGMGDGLCATVSTVDASGIWTRISETPLNASLGSIYSETTQFLGMKPMEHEYKVMGLAAYCKGYHVDLYNRVFKPVIDLDPDCQLRFKARLHTAKFYDYLSENAVGERFDNLSGAVQNLLEDLVVRWIAAAIEKTGIRRVFTGGGVFMNVKLNMQIMNMPQVESVRFLPSCGDESNPIGALYQRATELGLPLKPLKNLYLGISYTRDQLLDFVQMSKLSEKYIVSEPADIEVKIAELLSQKAVVARFSGRCEWGARSLGNRAILAHPSYMESFHEVNDLIKARDFWMPFAPSILDVYAEKYLKDYHCDRCPAPHMITAYHVSSVGETHLRAALHQGDKTARPQVVTKDQCPDYYRMIREFEKYTGVGAVLNTSFNLHGFPLVATPQQALMTFESSGLPHLALGSFLISKRYR